MSIDIRQDGRNNPALRRPRHRVKNCAVRLSYPCLQPFAYQVQKCLVIYAKGQHFQQPVMVTVVEEALNVGLHHIPKPSELQLESQVSDRVIGASACSIPLADIQELLFIDGVEHHRHRPVHHRVFQGGNSQRPFFPVVFWNICSSDQFRFIAFLFEPPG